MDERARDILRRAGYGTHRGGEMKPELTKEEDKRKCFYYGASFRGRIDGIESAAHEAGRALEGGDVRRAEREWKNAQEWAQDLIRFTKKVKEECGVDYTGASERIKRATDEKLRWEVHHEVWDLTTELINWALGLDPGGSEE